MPFYKVCACTLRGAICYDVWMPLDDTLIVRVLLGDDEAKTVPSATALRKNFFFVKLCKNFFFVKLCKTSVIRLRNSQNGAVKMALSD